MKQLEYKGPYVYRGVFKIEDVDRDSLIARQRMIENARYLAIGDTVIFEPVEGKQNLRWVNNVENGTKTQQHFVNGEWENVPVFWVD